MFRGGFNRGFLVSARMLSGVVTTTRVAGSSFMLRVKPKVKAVARCLTYTTEGIITIRVSGTLVPVLRSALSSCSGTHIVGGSILGMSVTGLTRRRGKKGPVGIITGLPCCVAAPVVVKLFRGRIPVGDVAIVIRGRITSHVRIKPKAGSCNTLSLTIRCCTGPCVITGMPPGYFVPHPGIKSTMVHLRHCRRPPIGMGSRGLVFHVVHTSFGREEGALTGKLGGSTRLSCAGRRVRTTVRTLKENTSVQKRTLALRRFTGLTSFLCSYEWGGVGKVCGITICGGMISDGFVLLRFLVRGSLVFDWLFAEQVSDVVGGWGALRRAERKKETRNRECWRRVF